MSLKIIGAAIKAAEILAGVGTGVTIGEAVLKRAGVVQKDTSILVEGANIALDVFGAPRDSALRPGTKRHGQTASLGDAAADPRVICVDCQRESDMPLLAGAAGEEIVLGQCQKHYENHFLIQGRVDSMYEGWAQSIGLGDSAVCGAKPDLKSARYKKYKKVGTKQFGYQDPVAYFRDVSEWQQCIAADKAQTDATVKQIDATKAAAKQSSLKSAYALAAQQKKYSNDIDALLAAQAAEKDTAAKAEMQAKIDAAMAAKAAAEQLANELRTKEQSTEIEALKAQIAAQSSKPGGMDSFMQMYMMQMMANQPSAAASQQAVLDPALALQLAAQQQQMSVDPMALLAPAQDPYADPYAEVDYYMAGGDEAPMDPDAAEMLGVSGARTLGEAQALYELRHGGGFSEDELAAAMDDLGSSGSLGGCTTGCAIG